MLFKKKEKLFKKREKKRNIVGQRIVKFLITVVIDSTLFEAVCLYTQFMVKEYIDEQNLVYAPVISFCWCWRLLESSDQSRFKAGKASDDQ